MEAKRLTVCPRLPGKPSFELDSIEDVLYETLILTRLRGPGVLLLGAFRGLGGVVNRWWRAEVRFLPRCEAIRENKDSRLTCRTRSSNEEGCRPRRFELEDEAHGAVTVSQSFHVAHASI